MTSRQTPKTDPQAPAGTQSTPDRPPQDAHRELAVWIFGDEYGSVIDPETLGDPDVAWLLGVVAAEPGKATRLARALRALVLWRVHERNRNPAPVVSAAVEVWAVHRETGRLGIVVGWISRVDEDDDGVPFQRLHPMILWGGEWVAEEHGPGASATDNNAVLYRSREQAEAHADERRREFQVECAARRTAR